MSVLDASAIPDGSELRADLCVVCSGPAGLALAVELNGAGLDVLLLESGGLDVDGDAEDLAAVECGGLPLATADPRRARRFGGTTAIWYGRLARYDEIDFARRAWVPRSGWPIPRAEVLRYEQRSARFFSLDRVDAFDAAAWSAHELPHLLPEDGALASGIHLWPRHLDLGRVHLPALRRSDDVRVLLRAHATRLDTTPDARAISSLTVRGADGRSLRIAARAYVLACGGWENPRLLLLSRDRDGNALGNRHDAVGRCYMNHPRNDGIARIHLDLAQPCGRALLDTLVEKRDARAHVRRQFAFRIDEQRQRAEELLNVESFAYPVGAPRLRETAAELRSLPQALRRRDVAGTLRALGRVGAATPLLARAAASAIARRPFLVDHLALVDQGEQVPAPESRIVLGERRDRFGDPLLRVQWAIGAETTRSQRRLHELIAAFLARSGCGRLESALFDPSYEPRHGDAAHAMGTTRMSDDPRSGVVDARCRVHGVENLWIAGSSVFPTGGHAAPTWTIVCLALRLADELRARLHAG